MKIFTIVYWGLWLAGLVFVGYTEVDWGPYWLETFGWVFFFGLGASAVAMLLYGIIAFVALHFAKKTSETQSAQ